MALYVINVGDHLELSDEATLVAVQNVISTVFTNREEIILHILRDTICNLIDLIFVILPDNSKQEEIDAALLRFARHPGILRIDGPINTIPGVGKPHPAEPRLTPEQARVIQRELQKISDQVTSNQSQFELFMTQVQFIGEPFAPAVGVRAQSIAIEATSAQAVRILTDKVKQIRVIITGGTAPGKKLKSADGSVVGAVDEAITVPMTQGRATIIAEASGAGDMDLALDGSVDAVAATLSTADTANITYT